MSASEGLAALGGYPEDGGIHFSEMFVTIYQPIWPKVPGDLSPNQRRVLC
jgi:hypothetical protein